MPDADSGNGWPKAKPGVRARFADETGDARVSPAGRGERRRGPRKTAARYRPSRCRASTAVAGIQAKEGKQ